MITQPKPNRMGVRDSLMFEIYPNGQKAVYFRKEVGKPRLELTQMDESLFFQIGSSDVLLKDLPVHFEILKKLIRKQILSVPFRYIIYNSKLLPICHLLI